MFQNKTKEETKIVQIPETEWLKIQDQLKMLYDVADKGRLYSYENQRVAKKSIKVKLTTFQDKFIISWNMLKDIPIYHPTTGEQVGEEQKIEITLLDKDGTETKQIIDGYKRFSDIRYNKRVECEVVSKKEYLNEKGETEYSFEVRLPDDRVIILPQALVN